jgi:hypothetical protein
VRQYDAFISPFDGIVRDCDGIVWDNVVIIRHCGGIVRDYGGKMADVYPNITQGVAIGLGYDGLAARWAMVEDHL